MYIYPSKKEKIVSFDSKRDEILRNGVEAAMSKRPGDSKSSKGKSDSLKGGIGGGMSTQDKIDEMFLKSLREEEKRDYGGVDLSKKLVD